MKMARKMQMVLGVPVLGNKEWTKSLLESLEKTVLDKKNFQVVLIDNNSNPAYKLKDFGTKLKIKIIKNKENRGYYYPLLQLFRRFKDELIGLAHNDLYVYEEGWDQRLKETFQDDERLGVVGFAGFVVLYQDGGLSCPQGNFKGLRGATFGEKVKGLKPCAAVDSLFMMFRRKAIPFLKINKVITVSHFYDRIWSCRLIQANWRIAVLGTEIDHHGGVTTESDSNKELVYREAMRRFLEEFNNLLPIEVTKDYKVKKL